MPGESLNLDICCCRVSKNGEFGIYVKEGGWGTYEDNDVRYVYLHVYVPEFAVCERRIFAWRVRPARCVLLSDSLPSLHH